MKKVDMEQVEKELKQPKTRKGRKLQKLTQTLIEGPKQTLFLKGNKSIDAITQCLKDLYQLKKQYSVNYTKKHDIHPFEDASQIIHYCEKNFCNLFILGSNSKKRPNNLVIGRIFQNEMLDMVELGVDYFKSTQLFKKSIDISFNSRPVIIFQGDVFEYHNTFIKMKNLFLDFFSENIQIKSVDIMHGLTHAIVISANEQKIWFRTYGYKVKKAQNENDQPENELEEIGPSIDFSVRREQWAADDVFKLACKQPKVVKKKENKNIKRDEMGDKRGQVYVDKQNLEVMGIKKRKKLKVNTKEKDKQKQLEKQIEFNEPKQNEENINI